MRNRPEPHRTVSLVPQRVLALESLLHSLAAYLILTPEAMGMIGESYPFIRGNYYMTIIGEENDTLREFAICKESKVIPMPETWLNLRIKGSQHSQFLRRKCKHIPKGLFSCPAIVNETRYSMHWISEAHRNSWACSPWCHRHGFWRRQTGPCTPPPWLRVMYTCLVNLFP